MSNVWQECPVCRGKGSVLDKFGFAVAVCSVRKGKQIISKLDGKPPRDQEEGE